MKRALYAVAVCWLLVAVFAVDDNSRSKHNSRFEATYGFPEEIVVEPSEPSTANYNIFSSEFWNIFPSTPAAASAENKALMLRGPLERLPRLGQTAYHEKDFVFVCKRSQFDIDCTKCQAAIDDRNLALFKLGMVYRVSPPEKGTMTVAYVDGSWGILNSAGYPVGDFKDENEGDHYLIRATVAPSVRITSRNVDSKCIKPLSFSGSLITGRGDAAFDRMLKTAQNSLGEYFTGLTDYMARSGLDMRDASSVRTEQFMIQLEAERNKVMSTFDAYRARKMLDKKKRRQKRMIERAVNAYQESLLTHSRLSVAVTIMLKNIKKKLKGKAPLVCQAPEVSSDGDPAMPRNARELFEQAKELKKERDEVKWNEYSATIEGFGAVSLYLVAAAADAGVPGLGTLMQYSALGAEVSGHLLGQVLSNLDATGIEKITGVLRDVYSSMGSVDEAIVSAAEVTQTGDAGIAAMEAMKEDVEGVVNENIPGTYQTNVIKEGWRKVVGTIGSIARDATAAGVKAGVTEGVWASATLLPLLGPYVGMTREVKALLNQMKESRASFQEYIAQKDQIYDSVFSMRDCGLKSAVIYTPPAKSDVVVEETHHAKKMKRRVTEATKTVGADIMSLRATVEAAVAAMKANYRLREWISNVARVQELFAWDKKAAHEDRVMKRLHAKFGKSRTSPNEWSAAFSGAIVEACNQVKKIMADVSDSNYELCCEEDEDSCDSASSSPEASPANRRLSARGRDK